jgi:hypothetical protein
MYDVYIVQRTQIYLTEGQGRLLERRSRATGLTVSQLIRDAIDAAYGAARTPSRAERARVARQTAGSWSAFPETGARYVDRLRGTRRLSRAHGLD